VLVIFKEGICGKIFDNDTYWRIKPAVNQVECHPFLVQDALRNYCKLNNIFVEAYSSLGQGEVSLPSPPKKKLLTKSKLVKEGEVLKIAESYKKTPAQILLRWGLQQNLGTSLPFPPFPLLFPL
jgi:diketogulonate reductase-like aldo/keto reductase